VQTRHENYYKNLDFLFMQNEFSTNCAVDKKTKYWSVQLMLACR